MEIIEISSQDSSPRPSMRPLPKPKTRHSQQPLAQKRARRVDTDVIELTDSDSEDGKDNSVDTLIKKSRSSFIISEPRAGGSWTASQSMRKASKRPRPSQDPPAQPVAGASANTGGMMPLFLPNDDEIARGEALAPPRLPSPVAQALPPQIIEVAFVEPEPIVETVDTLIARVLEIIPDVQPAHVLSLLEKHADVPKDGLVESVLHTLFEDSNYPKVDKKGKRRRDDVEEEEGDKDRRKSTKLDYGNKERLGAGGPQYADIALPQDQLLQDFPYIPKPHVRRIFFAQNAFYAPSYIYLAEEKKLAHLPYVVKSQPSRPGKGKLKADPEFERERTWLLDHLQDVPSKHDEPVVQSVSEEEAEECLDGIECGCCFSAAPFDKMIQCPDCHLFCTECMTSYASNLLGARDNAIICMDQSGCKLPFPESELKRFLTPKLLALYERVTQQKEIDAAGLEGLEECPFCEYKIIIDNPDEKLFHCENTDCGAVSCRACKKSDHLPKSCKEVDDDKKLDARHLIEEAMSRALMRNCPQCQKGFLKESGCNKMTCPNCHTLSCYVCRQPIVGYDHFNQAPAGQVTQAKSAKCLLWDAVEQRHGDEVRKAAQEAVDEYKRHHPNLTEEELKAIEVELPPAPPAPGPAPVQVQIHPFGGQYPALPGLDHQAGLIAQQQARMLQQRAALQAQAMRNAPDLHQELHLQQHAAAHAQAMRNAHALQQQHAAAHAQAMHNARALPQELHLQQAMMEHQHALAEHQQAMVEHHHRIALQRAHLNRNMVVAPGHPLAVAGRAGLRAARQPALPMAHALVPAVLAPLPPVARRARQPAARWR